MKASDHHLPIKGEKIVSAKDMASYEKSFIQKDPSLAETYMDTAALGLHRVLEQRVLDHIQVDRVVLLIGKGNNGGDAYALGSLLLQSGYKVIAYQLFEEISSLSATKAKAFKRNSGDIFYINEIEELKISDQDLIIDGLLGTGFKGEVTGLLSDAIEECNSQEAFVFSIDIASGVDGNSGLVLGSAIYADMTGYLGALKIGHLFEKGLEHAGMLHYIDFGLDLQNLQAHSYLFNSNCLYHNLPRRSRLGNKYDVGQILVFAGTNQMKGAAELCCMAAYRAGCGLIKHFYLGSKECLIKEVISQEVCVKTFEKELLRSKALLIGPGLGRDEDAKNLVDRIMKLQDIPMVIDADALFLMEKPPRGSIITPHKGELLHLLGLSKNTSEEEIVKNAQSYSDKNEVYIIYKGMPTVILSPKEEKIVLVAGNPGMSTGGTGDVLSGIVASFLAQGCDQINACTLGVTVHGKAGDLAANTFSERYMIASDVIFCLSQVFTDL